MCGRCSFVLGAPNAAKTATLGHLANRWAREGIALAFLGVDEDPEDFFMRIAQQAGFPLNDCETRDARTIDGVELACGALPLRFYGFDWTIDAAADGFATFMRDHGIRRRAFVADSLQTIRSLEGAAADGPRALVDANVRTLRSIAQRHRWVVLATSEMNRGAYRNEDSAERYNDMAAGKESGGIEYAAAAQLTLRSVKGERDLIHVRAPKVKRGREVEFFLRFERDAHRLTECEGPDRSGEETARDDAARARNVRQVNADAKVLAEVVLAHPGIGSRDLRAELRRAGHGWGVDRLEAAKHALGRRLENRGPHERKSSWHLVSEPAGADRK